MILLGLITTIVFAKNVLVIGDSHMAGPFGPKIHDLISKNHHVVTLGHASSAAYHWMDPSLYTLSGGVFNQARIDGKNYYNPNPTHWSVKVKVPKFSPLLENALYHEEWRADQTNAFKPDVVIVELGANDTKIIADENGRIITSGYKQRKDALLKMVTQIKESKAECIWVGPPDGVKKNPLQVKILYDLLNETVATDCRFFDSLHYKASVCSDGVHFSCGSDMAKARLWATEVFEFTGL
jgi:hypothetical protein